jgi:hypothetical protein
MRSRNRGLPFHQHAVLQHTDVRLVVIPSYIRTGQASALQEKSQGLRAEGREGGAVASAAGGAMCILHGGGWVAEPNCQELQMVY